MAKSKKKRKNGNQGRQKPQAAKQGKEAASKKQEEQIQTITAAAMSIIYDENSGVEKTLLPDAMKRAQSIVDHPSDAGPLAIADVALWVLEQVEQQAQTRKKKIRPEISAGALGTIVPQVAEVAMVVGIDLSEEDIQVGVAAAINKYIAVAKKEGRVTDKELLEAAKALEKKYPEELKDFNQMIQKRQQRQQADKQNRQGAPPAQPPPQAGGGQTTLLQNRPVKGGA